MAKGRPRDPARARRGTGHRPLPGHEKPRTEGAALRLVDPSPWPQPPADMLPEVSRERWLVAMEALWPRGLRPADLPAIRLMCEQAAIAYEAANGRYGWARVGVLIPDMRNAAWDQERGEKVPTGVIENPAVQIGGRATERYMRIAQSFGLDVASRMRLGLMQLAGQSITDALLDEVERG